MITEKKRDPRSCWQCINILYSSVTVYRRSKGCFPDLKKHFSFFNVYDYLFFLGFFFFFSTDTHLLWKANWNARVTKVPVQFQYESRLISIGCIASLRRLPDWAVLEAYRGIQDAHHNKMLMANTKLCVDRISIWGLLTVGERVGLGAPAL